MGLWEEEGVWSWGGGEGGGREGVGGGWGGRGGPNSLSELSSVFLPAIITSNLDETKSSSYRVDADNSFLLQICSPLPFPPFPSLSLPLSTNTHVWTQTCTGVCSVSLGAAFSATVHVPQEKPE